MTATVHYLPAEVDEVDFSGLGAAVLELAGELDAAEVKVRGAVLAAIEAGDVGRAEDLVRRWTREPIEKLAAGL